MRAEVLLAEDGCTSRVEDDLRERGIKGAIGGLSKPVRLTLET